MMAPMRRRITIDSRRLEKAVNVAITNSLAEQLAEQGLELGGPPIEIDNVPLVGTLTLLLDDGVETIEIQQDRVDQ